MRPCDHGFLILIEQGWRIRRLRQGAVAVLALMLCTICSGCGTRTSAEIITTSVSSYLPYPQAKGILATGHLRVVNGGALCAYEEEDSGLVPGVDPADSTPGSVPFMDQVGSHLVTLDGVKTSWRESTSATRSSILALRDHGVIFQVTLSPSVSDPMGKAEGVMTDV
jgi:hypothetical protein